MSSAVFRLTAAAIAAVVVAVVPVGPARADQIRDSQWHLAFLRITEAHRHSQGEGVAVAVVDTGVDASHPDLAGAVVPGTDLRGGDGRQDTDGHGTAMAGLIAARGRPGGAGVMGIAPKSTVIPVETGGTLGRHPSHDGIDWAVRHGAKVINMSQAAVGGGRLEAATRRAVEADVVLVAGAGNRPDVGVRAPAKFPGVIAAVGVDRAGNHAEISVTGPEAVLAAPAVDMVTTGKGGGYHNGTGTSDATAIISGVVALVRAKFPHLKAPEVIHRLTATAIDKGKPGRDEEYGFGIVDPVAALTADVPPLSPSAAPSGSRPGATPPSTKDSSSPVGWILGGLLLAAAGVGAAIALRRARRARRVPERERQSPLSSGGYRK